MSQYTVVRSTKFVDFIMAVNQHLAEGWKPQGGVSSDDFYFMQAMFRE